MEKKPFIIEMKTEIIPWLEDVIIRKQKDHLNKLLEKRLEMLNPPWYRQILPGYNFFFQKTLDKLNKLIETNTLELKYYYTKLAEYRDWVRTYEAA
jgi:hypothetical protein